MLADMVDEKHAKLHREYQELLQDHMGDPLPDALRAGHDKPEDLKASESDELCESCHVPLCTSTFKRDFQLKEVMAINLAQTWAWRRRVTWCIFDANREQDLWEWVRDTFSFALQTGHLVWVRAQKPWDTFHMSVATNTACQAAFEATIKDRVRTIEEAGLTADVAALTKRTFVVKWDNDNILTWMWLHDALRSADLITGAKNGFPEPCRRGPVVGRSASAGRIGSGSAGTTRACWPWDAKMWTWCAG